MSAEMIADILINMSLDMDYADFLEFYDDEVKEIAEELKTVSKALFVTLENIAAKNSDLYQWAKNNEEVQP